MWSEAASGLPLGGDRLGAGLLSFLESSVLYLGCSAGVGDSCNSLGELLALTLTLPRLIKAAAVNL